jgi:hypothetical protein
MFEPTEGSWFVDEDPAPLPPEWEPAPWVWATDPLPRCPHCGAVLVEIVHPDGSTFCATCGEQIEESPTDPELDPPQEGGGHVKLEAPLSVAQLDEAPP